MKKLLALLLISVAVVVAASAPTIAIVDLSNVTINGANAGAVADVIANNPTIAPAVQQALDAYLADRVAAATKTGQDITASTVAQRDAQLAASAAYIAKLQAALRAAHVEVPIP